jgi:HEAT repeat protein
MPSLSSSIVNQHVASVRDVEEALSRQALYGGDLITNLLELANVSEDRLCLVKAESHGLEAAPIGELPVTTEHARSLVSAELAQRFTLYPLEERDGALIVAVAEPLPREAEQDLASTLKLSLVQKVALLVRVRQALARDYGLPLDRRSLRVLAKLSGRPDPNPSSLPGRPDPPLLSRRPPTVLPRDPSLPAGSDRASSAQPAELPVPRAGALPDLSGLMKADAQRRPRRLGPYTATMAEHDLRAAETRDDIVRAFFDFSGQYFEYAALFAVQGDLAEGRDACGSGAARARVVGIGVPLDLPSALSRARDSSGYQLTRLASGGLDGTLAQDLERRPGQLVLFLPVRVRGRTILILYGDHGDRDVELSTVGDVISFAPLVATAFEQWILKRRRAKGSSPPARARPADAAGPPESLARPMISIGATREAKSSQTPASSADIPGAPPEDGWVNEASGTPFPSEEHGTKPGVGGAREAQLSAYRARHLGQSQRTGSLPRLQLVPESDIPAPASDDPEIEVRGATHDADKDELGPPSSQGAPLASSSRALAYSARPPPAREHSPEVLPSVMVDLAQDCNDLIARLLDGNAAAGEELAQIGDAAITQLVRIFPGPITAEVRRGGAEGPAKASDCGPVLRVLARMGTRPVPFVAVRTADGDPIVRAWATRLLGEMPTPEAAHAVVRRLTDEDPEVRRAALAAGHLLLSHAEAGEALQAKLAESVSDLTRPEENRHSLLEAIAELRAPLVIPRLVRLLDDRSGDIARSAHWALCVITRQDFGTRAEGWDTWWLASAGRHRIEWLIDALLHDNQELRRVAGDELKSLTKEYFGYYDDLPKKERERAQERYRNWWETKGKARFR